MTDDPTPNSFVQHDDEYVPLVPNHAKRNKERKGKPRAAQEQDLRAAMDRIIDDILERDGRNLREMKYRGRR